MIYTITFNPALDYIMVVPSCRSGEVNRTESEKIMAGGKGINVSIVLNNMVSKIRHLALYPVLRAVRLKIYLPI